MLFFSKDNLRRTFAQLVQSSAIAEPDIDKALGLSGVYPDNDSWRRFIEYVLLILGVMALATSVVFFIAYNWDAMGRFAKFGLLEALIVLCIGVYWKTYSGTQALSDDEPLKKKRVLFAQLALFLASVFVGVLLAFYGQTYQTGADTWELFLTWSLLIIPWVLVAGFAPLYLLWLALMNTAIILYYTTFNSVLGMLLLSTAELFWVLTILNTSAFLIAEWLEHRFAGTPHSWLNRIIAVSAGLPMSLLVLDGIFSRNSHFLPPFIVWLLSLSILILYFRRYKPDLFMLAMGCLSAITIIIAGIARLSFENIGDGVATFFFLAIAVIALGAMSAIWLKKVHHEFVKGGQYE